jgi:hypothetical protein
VDLSVAVATSSEDVLQEHQLGLQAVFITESSGSVYLSRYHRLHIGWVMMGDDGPQPPSALTSTRQRAPFSRLTAFVGTVFSRISRVLARHNIKSVLTRATWHNMPEDTILRSHRRENLKSYLV